MRGCGRYPITPDGSVQVRARGQSVGYAGLPSCGSVWADPVCNSKVQAVRRLEVAVGASAALVNGGGAFGAYTVRHRLGEPLEPLWRALSRSWRAVAQDKGVRQARADLGHVGVIRAAEATYGENGWHPHLHPFHVFGRPVDSVAVAQLHGEQFRAWSAAADRLGLAAPVMAAQHLHAVLDDAVLFDVADVLGDYFVKSTYAGVQAVSWEVTSTQTKTRTRWDSATPWELLRRVYREGDADALALWHHWEHASKGKRALTWSRGLRTRLGLDVELDDQAVAEREIGSSEDAGFLVTDWSPIRERPDLGGRLLTSVINQDWQAGRRFCDEHAIPYQEVPR